MLTSRSPSAVTLDFLPECFFFTAILGVSGVVNIFATTIGAALPLLASTPGHFAVVLLVLGLLAWINIRGVRAGARAVDAVTLVKVIPLLIFVAVGIFLFAQMRLPCRHGPARNQSVTVSFSSFSRLLGSKWRLPQAAK